MKRALFILALGAALVTRCGAQGEWILIDRDLREHRIELSSLGESTAEFIDEHGKTQSRPVDSILAILHSRPPEERPPRDPPWITRQLRMFGPQESQPAEGPVFQPSLELTDGQRWVGSLQSAGGETIDWAMLGVLTLRVPLERVRAAAIAAPITDAAADWSGIDDRLILINGDVLEGFVASVGPEIEVESSGSISRIPLGRAAGLLLANPPRPTQPMVAWIDDGSVIAVTSIRVGVTGNIELGVGEDSTESGRLRRGDLRAVLFDASAVTGLASIDPSSVKGPEDFPWVRPEVGRTEEVLGAGDVSVRGPARIAWSFDRPAARFSAIAVLPPANWAWGDCEIVVRTGDGLEVFRERVHGGAPRAEINVPLGGSTGLVIEIEAGRGGAVQDGVTLVRPIVLWH